MALCVAATYEQGFYDRKYAVVGPRNERRFKRNMRIDGMREVTGGCAASGAILLFAVLIIFSFILGDHAEAILEENAFLQLFGGVVGLCALIWFCLSLPRIIREYAAKAGSWLILLAIVLALIDAVADVRTGRAITLSGNVLSVFVLGIIVLGVNFILIYRNIGCNDDRAFDKVREVLVYRAGEHQDCILIENNVFDALDDIIVTLFAPMEQLWGGTSVTQGEQQAGKDLRIKVEHVDRGKYLVKIPNTIANYQRSASLLKLENIAGVTFIEIAFSAEGRHWIKRGGSQDVVTEIPVMPSDYYGSGSVPDAWAEAKQI